MAKCRCTIAAARFELSKRRMERRKQKGLAGAQDVLTHFRRHGFACLHTMLFKQCTEECYLGKAEMMKTGWRNQSHSFPKRCEALFGLRVRTQYRAPNSIPVRCFDWC
jgi:hypothetical protein